MNRSSQHQSPQGPATPPLAPSGAPGAGAARRSGALRGAQLVGGLVLYAASMALLVRSELGNMPWDVLTQGITRHVPWSFGTVTIAVSVLVLLCWVPLRQRPGIGTVANVVVIGLLVDPAFVLLDLLPEHLPLWAQLGLAAAGIVTNGLATAIYIGARLGPGPRDGLMTGLVARTRWQVRWVRMGIEGSVVAIGWLLGGTVGFTTLAYALLIGPIVHWLMPIFDRRRTDVVVVGTTATVNPASRPA